MRGRNLFLSLLVLNSQAIVSAVADDDINQLGTEITAISKVTASIGNGSLDPQPPNKFDCSYIMDKPQLVSIFGDYYLLSIPFRLQTDETYERVECRAMLRLEDDESKAFNWKETPKSYSALKSKSPEAERPVIISVYPTRQTLTVSYDRTNSLQETFSPQWAGVGAGEIQAKQQHETKWDSTMEHALGSFDNNIGQVQWEYLPAKNQHVPTGIMTAYTVLKVPSNKVNSVWATPYEYCKTGWFAKGGVSSTAVKAVYDPTISLLQFAQLRNGELDDSGAKFIADLQGYKLAKDKTDDGRGKKEKTAGVADASN